MVSHGEIVFSAHLSSANIPFVSEYRFHPKRRWRFDFALPEHMVAIEIEGGVHSNGRHTRGSGFTADCEKYNTAAAMGWKVFRFPTGKVMDNSAFEFVRDYLRDTIKT